MENRVSLTFTNILSCWLYDRSVEISSSMASWRYSSGYLEIEIVGMDFINKRSSSWLLVDERTEVSEALTSVPALTSSVFASVLAAAGRNISFSTGSPRPLKKFQNRSCSWTDIPAISPVGVDIEGEAVFVQVLDSLALGMTKSTMSVDGF